MQQYVILNKTRFNEFIARLAGSQKVVAPVARGAGQFAFAEVVGGAEVSLDYIPTILPPKKYFLPQYEALASFDKDKGQRLEPMVDCEEIIIFGAHTCDLDGIQCLNMVFSERPRDYNYLVRKSKITIIGYECNGYCDEYASCRLVHNHLPNGGYDLFFTDIGDSFMVHINTQTGEEIIEKTGLFEEAGANHLKALEKVREAKREIFKNNEVPIAHEKIADLFRRSYDHPVWSKLDEQCLACANCTSVCPTCYCFDVLDETDLDLKAGQRFRRWDSCQNEQFARVAGGGNFRKERGGRQRHRYYRKFKYPVEKFSRFFCTGCGRCSRACMAGINLKETLKTLIKGAGY